MGAQKGECKRDVFSEPESPRAINTTSLQCATAPACLESMARGNGKSCSRGSRDSPRTISPAAFPLCRLAYWCYGVERTTSPYGSVQAAIVR